MMNPEERAPNGALNTQYPEKYLADYASLSTKEERSPQYGTVSTTTKNADAALSGRERARRRWITIELIVLFVAGAFGALSTVKGQYIRRRVTEDLFANMTNETHTNSSQDSMCTMGNETSNIENEIQQITSQWILYFSIASSLPSLFTTLLIGTLSEQYGRRLAILSPCLGFLVQSIVSLLVVYLDLPLAFFFIGDVVTGFSGSLSLFMTGCFTYVTDITTEKQRMVRIVIIEILIFAGIGIMQVALGYLIHYIGFARTLWIPFAVLLISCINAGTPYLLIETVSPKSKADQRKLKAVLSDISHLFRVKTGNRHVILITYMVIGLFAAIVTQGSMQVTVLYGQGQPFCWESITIGFFITWSLLLPGIGTVAGAAAFHCCKLGYLWIVQISSVSGLLNVLALAMTFALQTTTLIFASTFLGLLKLLGVPVIRTSLSTIVDKHEHGALFASLGVLDGLSMFIAPLVLNGIYAATVNMLPTTVFFVMTAMMVVPILLTGILQLGLGQKREDRHLSINQGESEDEQVHEPLLKD